MDQLIINKLKSLKILYAEDEEGIRANIAETLRYYVKEVIEAQDGIQAFELYLKHKPNIIFSDILMKNTNGIDFAKKVRSVDSKIPIVLITAHTQTDYLLSAVELKLEQYLVKPVNLSKLKDALCRCLDTLGENLAIISKLVDDYSYDFDNKSLYKKDKAIKLTKKEVIFFELLLRNKHRVVSYEELRNEVWEGEFMSEAALKTLLRNIREKFPKQYIKNLSGVGYRLEI